MGLLDSTTLESTLVALKDYSGRLVSPIIDTEGVSLSRKYDFAVIVVCHLRKAQGTIKERILGSVGFVSLARSVVGITFKDDTRNIRIMANVKGNLSQNKTGIEFRIIDGVVNFNVTNIDYTAQMAGESAKADTVQKCREWLASYLPQCPEMLPSSEFYKAALEQGFSKKLAGTVAKDGLQIMSVQKNKMWYKANILSAAKEKMANDEVIVC